MSTQTSRDYIDTLRHRQELELTGKTPKRTPPTEFEGHGVLIVAKETAQDGIPLCLGIGPEGNKVRLVECFHDHVPPTLAAGLGGQVQSLSKKLRNTIDGTLDPAVPTELFIDRRRLLSFSWSRETSVVQVPAA